MNLHKLAAILTAVVMALCGMSFAACGDDDDDNNPSTGGKGGAAGASGKAGASGAAGGGDNTVGKVSGTVAYSGDEEGFLEVVLFSSKDPAIFVNEGPKGLVRVNVPAFPQAFTIEDVAPGHYWVECKINVGPEHVGPGPDDPTCFGKYDGMNWEREVEVDVVAGQTTTLAAPLDAQDPAAAAGAGGGGGGGAGGAGGRSVGLPPGGAGRRLRTSSVLSYVVELQKVHAEARRC